MELSIIKVNTQKQKQFNKKGIYTVEDLVKFLPRKYYDYRTPKKVVDLEENDNVSIIGEVLNVRANYEKNYVSITIMDSDKIKLDIIWFRTMYVERMLIIGQKYIFCGKVNLNSFTNKMQMTNPLFTYQFDKLQRIFPVYSKIQGMSDEYLKEKIKDGLLALKNDEFLDFEILKEYDIIRTFEMARNIHQPTTMEDIASAEKRMVFDSLFEMAFNICYESKSKTKTTSISCPNANTVKQLMNTLPFALTDGEESQLQVIRSIYKKMRSGERTSSLVQGDVGCGKTMVAMILMLIMAENGLQSVLMAPTNVLAKQHYEDFTEKLKMFPFIKTVFVNGSMKKKEKQKALEMIKNGEANIIIGTHAVIAKDVEFNNLALSIVDEEHRFGVAQRRLLKEKTNDSIHHVTMSATPIPRSLGMSIYGEDTNIYSITKMPAGRKPIKTTIETDIIKGYQFIENQINEGRQAYVICPLINDSDSERLEDVDSVMATYDELQYYFKKNPSVKIGVINGKMKQNEVADEIAKFYNKEYDIIVSTTIVEVGVNVPNATVILIKNAERFGLAQLHQLRGRVGRGSHQSFCLLTTPKEDVERLEVMTQTNNGFIIAQKDLELRGMGDFIGTNQTGDFKNVMLMLSNKELYDKIKNTVWEVLKDEKRTEQYKFLLTKNKGDEID